jgi:predicted transcriptional regulator
VDNIWETMSAKMQTALRDMDANEFVYLSMKTGEALVKRGFAKRVHRGRAFVSYKITSKGRTVIPTNKEES